MPGQRELFITERIAKLGLAPEKLALIHRVTNEMARERVFAYYLHRDEFTPAQRRAISEIKAQSLAEAELDFFLRLLVYKSELICRLPIRAIVSPGELGYDFLKQNTSSSRKHLEIDFSTVKLKKLDDILRALLVRVVQTDSRLYVRGINNLSGLQQSLMRSHIERYSYSGPGVAVVCEDVPREYWEAETPFSMLNSMFRRLVLDLVTPLNQNVQKILDAIKSH